MRQSLLVAAASLASVYATGLDVGAGFGLSLGYNASVSASVGLGLVDCTITTSYVQICSTGLSTVETTFSTQLPSSIDINTPDLSDWVTTECECSACGEGSETVTLTLPPDQQPTVPASVEASATGSALPSSTDLSGITGPGTGTGGAGSSATGDVYVTSWTTDYVYLCPTGLVTSQTVISTELPQSQTEIPTELPSGWTTTVTVCTACQGAGASSSVTLTLPPNVDVSGSSSSEIAGITGPSTGGTAQPSQTGDVYVTSWTTDYVYLCPTGLVTSKTVLSTELPQSQTVIPTELPSGWTTTVTVCTVCEGASASSAVTLTLPPNVDVSGSSSSEIAGITGPSTGGSGSGETSVPIISAPTPSAGEDSFTTVITTEYETLCPTGISTATTEITKVLPTSASGMTLTVSMTEIVTICTRCQNGGGSTSVTLTVPAETAVPITSELSSQPSTSAGSPSNGTVSTQIPVIGNTDIPSLSSGEAAITTVIETEYTTVCPFTSTYESVVTNSGGSEITSTFTSEYEQLTTTKAQVTQTIPQSLSGTTISLIMTQTVVTCTKCASGSPGTYTISVPVESQTSVLATVSQPGETQPGESSVLATASQPGETQPGESSVPEQSQSSVTATTSVPVVGGELPTPTGGEEAVTTIIETEYTTFCPVTSSYESVISSGSSVYTSTVIRTSEVLTKTSAAITKTIPASYSGSTLTISMTEIITTCTACASGAPGTYTLTVPAEQETTIAAEASSSPPSGVATTNVPVGASGIPSLSSGEAAITTVIETEYTTVCPVTKSVESVVSNESSLYTTTYQTEVQTLTTTKAAITQTIPASLSGTTLSIIMTETVCTACGSGSSDITYSVPAQTQTTIQAVASSPAQSQSGVVTSVPIGVPAISASEGEEVFTTTISTYYTNIATISTEIDQTITEQGTTYITKTATAIETLLTTQAAVTKTFPVSLKSSTFSFWMTETVTVCNACASGSASTLSINVPQQQETTLLASAQYPSASASMGYGSSSNSSDFTASSNAGPSATEEASEQFTGAASHLTMGLGSLVGGVFAVALLL